MTGSGDAEGLLRRLAPQVLGVLVRRYDRFDVCEDAVQEALLAAALQWREQTLPENPRAWLITVASRRCHGRAAQRPRTPLPRTDRGCAGAR